MCDVCGRAAERGAFDDVHVQPPSSRGLQRLRRRLRVLAMSDELLDGTLVVILLNTLCMALEGVCSFEEDGHCYRFKGAMGVLNVFFTVVFGLEFLVKIVGLGPADYFSVGANILDCIIVISSFVELPGVVATMNCYFDGLHPGWEHEKVTLPTAVDAALLSDETVAALTVPRALRSQDDGRLYVNPLQYYACETGGGFMTVLRAFRLVRLVKFLRGFPELRKQVAILVDIIKSCLALMALIVITLVIFAILGMNILGGLLRAEWEPELAQRGASVYVSLPVPRVWPNGTAYYDKVERHGTITERAPDMDGLAVWRVRDEWGAGLHAAAVNESLNLLLDGSGHFLAAALEDPEGELASVREAHPALGVIVGVPPRLHFDDLGHALLTTFQVMTIANWNDNLYDAYVALHGSVFAAAYYWAVVIVGNWMLFNLFVAILIQKFLTSKQQDEKDKMAKMQKRIVFHLGDCSSEDLFTRCMAVYALMDTNRNGGVDILELKRGLKNCWGLEFANKFTYEIFSRHDGDGSGMIASHEFLALSQELVDKARNKELAPPPPKADGHADGGTADGEDASEAEHNAFSSDFLQRLRHGAAGRSTIALVGALRTHIASLDAGGSSAERKDMALFCLSPDNVIRRACVALSDTSRTEGKWFNNLVLGCILLTTVALSAENQHIGRHSTMYTFLLMSDYIVNIAFTLEFLIKLVALGWNAYIASPWNKISLLIVVTSDLEMILSKLPAVSSSAGILRIFRIFRVLRPLRMAAESFPGLLVLVNTAQMSAGPLGNTLCMTMIILCVLSIIGLQIFAHKMSACSDAGVWTKLQCTGLDDDQIPREWQAYPVNFDNLVQGRCPRAVLAGRGTHASMYACLDVHTHTDTHTYTHTHTHTHTHAPTQVCWRRSC